MIRKYNSEVWQHASNDTDKQDKQVNRQILANQYKIYSSDIVQPKKHITDYKYLDNNGTTYITQEVREYMNLWTNCGNASASYSEDIGSNELIGNFKARIANYAKISLEDYEIIINSGASESNNFIINSVIGAYTKAKSRVPHIIVTSIEHKSLLKCAQQNDNVICHVTFISPEQDGSVNIGKILDAITLNTVLVCCMHANNETGAINNISQLSLNLSNREIPIPLYVDCTQTFGKFPLQFQSLKITAFATSFHKFGGPAGIGILVISRNFLNGYQLHAEICGAQNNGMRGGTENLSLIAGAFMALHMTCRQRLERNKKTLQYSIYIVRCLFNKIKAMSYFADWTDENIRLETGIPNYNKTGKPPNVEMVVLGSKDFNLETRMQSSLSNTIMISFLNHKSPDKFICNFRIVDLLRESGFIIGMGSACNTGELSYVLQDMKVPPVIIKGAIRISLCDQTEESDVVLLCDAILFALEKIINPEMAARRQIQSRGRTTEAMDNRGERKKSKERSKERSKEENKEENKERSRSKERSKSKERNKKD